MSDDEKFLRQFRIKSLLLDKEAEIAEMNYDLARNGYWSTDHRMGLHYINEALEKEVAEYREMIAG